jgi:Flp pilus assembly protein TadG
MSTILRKLSRRRGNAIVELALVMPIIAGAAVFIADIGASTHRSMTLKSATRAGAEYMLRTGDAAGVRAVVAAAANRNIDTISVTTTQFCICGTATATCGATCSAGRQEQLWTIAVSEPYTPILLPSPEGEQVRTLTAQATFRTR